MNKDIIHPVEEFGSCPFDKFCEANRGQWSVSCGGWGLRDGQWALQWVHKDLHAELWVLPEVFGNLFRMFEKNAVNRHIQKFRSLLEPVSHID